MLTFTPPQGRYVSSAFCDGGMIKSNPSPIGGTWAWVHVDGSNQEVARDSGVLLSDDKGRITNNVSELYAAVRCLEALPMDWYGTLYTDSQVTLYRLTSKRPSFKGVSSELRQRTMDARESFKGQVVLLNGHPTKAHLLAGRGKRGLPVSSWNVLVDRLCQEMAHIAYTDHLRKCTNTQ